MTIRFAALVFRRPLAASYAGLLRAAERRVLNSPATGRTLRLLTDAELAVLRLVATGETNAAIARQVGCSPRTVAKHLEHIYRKLDVANRSSAAARFAADNAALQGGAQ